MMKKIVIFMVAAMLSVVATAQPRAIGGRLGFGAQLSYLHTVGKNFIETDLGYNYAMGHNISARYLFVIKQPKWTEQGNWEFYAGPGLFIGTDWDFYSGPGISVAKFERTPFMFGITGQIGLAYTFKFPLQLSVDLRPTLNLGVNDSKVAPTLRGLFGFIPTIGVRYCFNKKD